MSKSTKNQSVNQFYVLGDSVTVCAEPHKKAVEGPPLQTYLYRANAPTIHVIIEPTTRGAITDNIAHYITRADDGTILKDSPYPEPNNIMRN